MFNRLLKTFGLERRQSFTGQVAAEIQRQAGQSRSDAAATGAAEAVIGLAARLVSRADVEPAALRSTITPSILAGLARSTLTTGNALYLAAVGQGGLFLDLTGPALDFDVRGGLNPATWAYLLEFETPDGKAERRALADAVIHVRINPAPATPWRGRGPLQVANLSAQMLANVEANLKNEMGGRSGYLVALPDGIPEDQANVIKAGMVAANGGTSIIETTAAGYGQGKAAAPQNDYESKRFGGAPPVGNVDLRDRAALHVLESFGASPGLWTGSGQDQREAYRLLHLHTLAPLADAIALELGQMFNERVGLDLERGQWRDHRTLSNAAVKYLDAGMTGDSIKRLMGLPSWVVFEDDAAIAGRAELRAKARAAAPCQTCGSTGGKHIAGCHILNGIERR